MFSIKAQIVNMFVFVATYGLCCMLFFFLFFSYNLLKMEKPFLSQKGHIKTRHGLDLSPWQ